MSPRDEQDKIAVLAVISSWALFLLIVSLAAPYLSMSSMMLSLRPLHIHMVLLLPGVGLCVATALFPAWRVFIRTRSSRWPSWESWAFGALIVYCFYLIALTGGLKASALNPLVVIAVLLAGPRVGESRSYLLATAAAGSIIVFAVSQMWPIFNVVTQYPPEWTGHGDGDEATVLGTLLISFFLDWAIESYARSHYPQQRSMAAAGVS